MAKETTLKKVSVNGLFIFGGVMFTKTDTPPNDPAKELILCKIYGRDQVVFIADHSIVEELHRGGGFVQL